MVGVSAQFSQHGASVPHLGWDVIGSDALPHTLAPMPPPSPPHNTVHGHGGRWSGFVAVVHGVWQVGTRVADAVHTFVAQFRDLVLLPGNASCNTC